MMAVDLFPVLVIAELVQSGIYDDEWRDDHVVDGHDGDHEVPGSAEGFGRIDQIPLELGPHILLHLIDIIVFILIKVYLFYILIVHLLNPCVELEFLAVLASLAPEACDMESLFFFCH